MSSRFSRIGACVAFLVAISIGGWLADSAESSSPPASPAAGAPHSVVGLDHATHDAGNVGTLVSNWGQIGSRPGSSGQGSAEPSLEWPRGSGVDYLWTAGLWIGGLSELEPSVTTTSYAIEVRPGTLAIDRLYASHENAPGGARTPAPEADDDRDGRIDEDRLNGRDDDGDGRVDEDFAAVSDQMFFGEYRDDDPAIQSAVPSHVPLGVRVEQSTYAWTDPRIDDLIGVEYLIVNEGLHRIDDLYFGLFADCDIGRRTNSIVAEDDRAGFWEGFVRSELGGPPRTVKVSIGYMFDADGDGGEAEGYAGLVYLGAERAGSRPDPAVRLRNFRMFSGRTSFASGGDPTNDDERYRTLNATDPMPLPAPDPGTGVRPALLASRSDDWRILLSAGKAAGLDPGDSVRIAFAFVLGHGFDALAANAARAIVLYENGWRTDDAVPIAVEDFEAASGDPGVRLAWKLSREAFAAARQVRVQRGVGPDGPFADVAKLAPASDMSWEDPGSDPPTAAWYRLALDLVDGGSWTSRALCVRSGLDPPASTAIEPLVLHPDGVEIRYRIAEAGLLDLAIFDVRGRRVASLARERVDPGRYLRLWDGRDERGLSLVHGVYFVRLEVGAAASTRKLVWARD